jgi:orotate phosphoribosyltransferase
MTTKDALRVLLDQRSLVEGQITLSSGEQSFYYFDCRPVTLSSEGASLVADAILDELSAVGVEPTAIGGLTHGADPIISAVMMRALERGQRIEGFYVRKEPKKHGTKKWIENQPPPGAKLVIVDDVVTTGHSVLKAVECVQEAGCHVLAVIALVDRCQGGSEEIRKRVPVYRALFSVADFPRIAEIEKKWRMGNSSLLSAGPYL